MEIENKTKDISLEKEIERTKRIEGNGIGAAVLSHLHFIREKKGEEGVKKVQARLKELGYDIDFDKIKAMEAVPLSFSYLVVLAAKEIFGWQDKEIFEMGNSAPKYSFVVKMIMKYLISIKKMFQESPVAWEKHYNVGKLESYKLNEREKYMVLRLRHDCPPTICTFYRGYFLRIVQYGVRSGKINIEETKCPNRGDAYHEFLMRWE
jgi:hypothetical protein